MLCIDVLLNLRLTAAKEGGASITIDGKKVALGIPGGGSAPTRTAGIPLGRAGSPDEAAASILLYVCPPHVVDKSSNHDILSLVSPLASYVSGHTLEVTGGAGI
jgi:3-oxoacyl-[acyl-carrier protein] reductase